MKLERWNPALDLFKVHEDLGRMIDRFFTSTDVVGGSFFDPSVEWLPGMDVMEDNDKFTITVELPGMKKDDVKITFRENTLVIEGEKKREEEKKDLNFHRVERHFGKFRRTFTLPTRVDDGKIDAKFKDGVLTITLPKAEEVKPKAIEVKVEG